MSFPLPVWLAQAIAAFDADKTADLSEALATLERVVLASGAPAIQTRSLYLLEVRNDQLLVGFYYKTVRGYTDLGRTSIPLSLLAAEDPVAAAASYKRDRDIAILQFEIARGEALLGKQRDELAKLMEGAAC